MKILLQLLLKYLSKMVLTRYKPEIIGVTGSVGKTTTKEAIYAVLASQFKVRRGKKNYNNEIGMPLTILGADSAGRSLVGWIKIFLKALKLALIKDANYPDILILEMGVDHPGDMRYLLSITKCDVGIITLIGPVHLEFFGTIDKIQKEKGRIIKKLSKNGWAILNYDDEKTRELAKITKANVITFGFNAEADISAQNASFSFTQTDAQKSDITGINFTLNAVLLPDIVGYSAIYAALAGAVVGIIHDMNLFEISQALKNFVSPPGRMNIIQGIKNTLIIDDTYNSSPQSAVAALDIVKTIPLPDSARKFAILGDMLELGSFSEKGHKMVGKYLVQSDIDQLITVGERSRDISRGSEESGMNKDNIFHFDNAESAGKFVQERMQSGDLVFVKGSQGMRMEKIVKEIMAEPMRAKELLVRQDEQWVK